MSRPTSNTAGIAPQGEKSSLVVRMAEVIGTQGEHARHAHHRLAREARNEVQAHAEDEVAGDLAKDVVQVVAVGDQRHSHHRGDHDDAENAGGFFAHRASSSFLRSSEVLRPRSEALEAPQMPDGLMRMTMMSTKKLMTSL